MRKSYGKTGWDNCPKELSKKFKIEYSGVGSKVIDQIPKGDTYVKEGSTVKLMLN